MAAVTQVRILVPAYLFCFMVFLSIDQCCLICFSFSLALICFFLLFWFFFYDFKRATFPVYYIISKRIYKTASKFEKEILKITFIGIHRMWSFHVVFCKEWQRNERRIITHACTIVATVVVCFFLLRLSTTCGL